VSIIERSLTAAQERRDQEEAARLAKQYEHERDQINYITRAIERLARIFKVTSTEVTVTGVSYVDERVTLKHIQRIFVKVDGLTFSASASGYGDVRFHRICSTVDCARVAVRDFRDTATLADLADVILSLKCGLHDPRPLPVIPMVALNGCTVINAEVVEHVPNLHVAYRLWIDTGQTGIPGGIYFHDMTLDFTNPMKTKKFFDVMRGFGIEKEFFAQLQPTDVSTSGACTDKITDAIIGRTGTILMPLH
jgi:hypothetical protein